MRFSPRRSTTSPFRAAASMAIALLAVVATAAPIHAIAAETSANGASAASDALRNTILEHDSALTGAYNTCKTAIVRTMFTASAELYFAERGATMHAFDHIDRLPKEFCGRYRRETPADAQRVYALPGHLGAIDGAIQTGDETFCAQRTDGCRGVATHFVAIWKRTQHGWKIARLIRYGYTAAQ